nr:IS5 family transposase [Ktedonobacter racemifer]
MTDAQWAILEPLIPPAAPDAPHLMYERREIANAMLYVLRSGCPWRMLPHDLPAWDTVYWYFRRWQREGVWEQILHALRKQVRIQHDRAPEPSAAIIDSQSLKTSAVRGPEKGYDSGKKIWGRKRHILVDTQGNVLAVKVTAASRSDQQGGKRMLELLVGLFPRIKLVWGDSHYAGDMILWLLQHLGWLTETIRRPVDSSSDQGTCDLATTKKENASSSGFRPLPRRWVVERSLAWITRWRRLCRDHEGLPASSEAFIMLAASRRMLSLLAPPFP